MGKKITNIKAEIDSFIIGGKTASLSIKTNDLESIKNLRKHRQDLEQTLNIVLEKYSKKRSINANAYFWVLADKLAEKTGIAKEDIYLNSIKNIGGVSELYTGKDEAIKRLAESWNNRGLGWISDVFPTSTDGYSTCILYYGSSSYDSFQMYTLIQNIVQDCKEQEIETRTPEEIERICNEW